MHEIWPAFDRDITIHQAMVRKDALVQHELRVRRRAGHLVEAACEGLEWVRGVPPTQSGHHASAVDATAKAMIVETVLMSDYVGYYLD